MSNSETYVKYAYPKAKLIEDYSVYPSRYFVVASSDPKSKRLSGYFLYKQTAWEDAEIEVDKISELT